MNKYILIPFEQFEEAKYGDPIPIECQFCGKHVIRKKKNIKQSLKQRGVVTCSSACKIAHTKCVFIPY